MTQKHFQHKEKAWFLLSDERWVQVTIITHNQNGTYIVMHKGSRLIAHPNHLRSTNQHKAATNSLKSMADEMKRAGLPRDYMMQRLASKQGVWACVFLGHKPSKIQEGKIQYIKSLLK